MESANTRLSAPAAGGRDGQIDLLKALAIFCVLLIHTCFYTDPVGSGQWTQAVLLGSLVRPAVPLFLMCSGALLLSPEKELPLKRLLGHNLPRILVSLAVWAAVYRLRRVLLLGWTPENLRDGLRDLLTFRHEFHFYYLHMIIVVYLFLPATRVFVRAADRRQIEYALILWFVFAILWPTLQSFPAFSWLPAQWKLNMTYGAIGYGLLGWYLLRRPLPRPVGGLLLLAGYGIVAGGTLFYSIRGGQLYEAFFEGMSVGVCMMSAGVFSLGGPLSRRIRGRAVAFVSRGSFCVYLVHVLFLYFAQSHGYRELPLPRLLLVPLTALAIGCVSLAVYWILSKIPVVNRWII